MGLTLSEAISLRIQHIPVLESNFREIFRIVLAGQQVSGRGNCPGIRTQLLT